MSSGYNYINFFDGNTKKNKLSINVIGPWCRVFGSFQ